MSTPRTPTAGSRKGLIEVITAPLGFYVLALLIVEAFIASVMIGGGLTSSEALIAIGIGAGMFALVVILVFCLVWFKPENLTFTKREHARRLKFLAAPTPPPEEGAGKKLQKEKRPKKERKAGGGDPEPGGKEP